MTIYLKQSTASQEILIGMMIDNTDGTTAKTGLTIANTDIQIWKAGATTMANKNDGGATEIGSTGYYYATLDATDTGTLGSMVINVNVAGALMWRGEFVVVTANWYDTMFSTDKLDVNVAEVSGDSTAADNCELFFDGTGYAGTNNVIPTVTTVTTCTNLTNAPTNGDLTATMKSSVTAAVPTAATVADAVWDEASTGHTDAGKAGAQMWTDVDAILEDTAVIGALGAGLTGIPWNAAWDAEVQSECADALTAYDPPTNAEMEARTIVAANYATAAALDTIDNFLDTEVAAILADTNELQTDWHDGGRLDLLLDGAASAGDPWSTALPGAYGAGTAGLLIGTTLPTAIADIPTVSEFEARSLPSADYVVVTDTIAGVTLCGTCTTNTDMRGTDSAALASVCTETRLGQLDEANMPTDLDNVFDDVGDVKAVVDDILADTSTTIPGTITTIDNFLDTEIAAILADTNELQTDLTNGGRLDLLIDAILEDTATTLPATLATLTARSYPNYKITSPVFSVTGKMTSCTLTRYPTKADADAGTNGIAYAVTATYDGDDNLATYNEVASA